MANFLKDLQYTVRALLRAPVFSIIAVLTLAIGIGGNTAIFSVVKTVLLDPLPFEDPETLVVVGGQVPGLGSQDLTASPAELRDYRDKSDRLDGLAASWMLDINITGVDQPARGQAALVSKNFLSVLRVQPILGRDFEDSDATSTGVGYVAILSYGAWQRFYGGDPAVIGTAIRIDDDPLTIVGVMPQGFKHPGQPDNNPVDIWGSVDLSETSRFGNFRTFRPLNLIGRLKEGVGIEEVRAEFATITQTLRQDYPQVYPEEAGWAANVVPLKDRVIGNVKSSLFVVFGAVGFVLLVACTNVANLLLARGAGRSREIAIRSALGGARSVIGRQFMLESVVLGVVGGIAGLVVAAVGTDLIKTLASADVPRIQQASVDTTALFFTLGISFLASIVFGLIPSLQLSKADMQLLLKEGGRGASGVGRGVRNALVVTEIAVSLVLLVGSGLLLKSFSRIMSVEPGFDPAQVMTMRAYLPWTINPQDGRYFQQQVRAEFYRETLRRVEELPEVRSAAMISRLPLRRLNGAPFAIEGVDQGTAGLTANAEARQITPDYFAVMSVPLIQGRLLSEADDPNGPRVMLVDQGWVRRFSQDENPIGRRVRLGQNPQAPWIEIVGVVGNVRQHGLDAEARGTMYMPYTQGVSIDMTYVMKTVARPEAVAAQAVAAIHTVDPTLPIFSQVTMEQVVAATVAERRLLMILMSGFAAQALILAAIGIYGVISQAVSQRTREIGIRMALGAENGGVMKLILGDGLRLSLAGVAVGLGVSAAISQVISSMLFSVGRFDPVVFGTVAVMAVVVSLAATLVPAIRATRVDPLLTMKAE
jgi:putative ABC transport system permease protein